MSDNIVSIFNNNISETYYSEVYGFTKNVSVYRNFTHMYAQVLFKIFEEEKLDYYVFAGTAIGYVRNKKNIPWIDDYDIIIFEKDIEKFTNTIIPKLCVNGFYCNKPSKKYSKSGYQIFSDKGYIVFLCEVFFSFIDKNGYVKNISNDWGLYNEKNVHISLVKPKKYLTIDGNLKLPFFNKFKEDVELEYGDIINNVVIHKRHLPKYIFNENYIKVYDNFNKVKNQIINNTRELFIGYQYLNNITFTNYKSFIEKLNFKINKVTNHISFLKDFKSKNVKRMNVMDEEFLIFSPDIKFYFPDVKIYFYMTKKIDTENIILLNYVDGVFCSKEEYIYFIEKYYNLLINKPKLDYIRVITFGTYDLFHIGHVNILKRAQKYGKLFVGVSTDNLNLKKGKKSINDFEKRKNDVLQSNYANHIFDEESLELKNQYVKKYDCNLLIMGDDWKDQFDFCDCACLYLKRTPGISTTQLKSH